MVVVSVVVVVVVVVVVGNCSSSSEAYHLSKLPGPPILRQIHLPGLQGALCLFWRPCHPLRTPPKPTAAFRLVLRVPTTIALFGAIYSWPTKLSMPLYLIQIGAFQSQVVSSMDGPHKWSVPKSSRLQTLEIVTAVNQSLGDFWPCSEERAQSFDSMSHKLTRRDYGCPLPPVADTHFRHVARRPGTISAPNHFHLTSWF